MEEEEEEDDFARGGWVVAGVIISATGRTSFLSMEGEQRLMAFGEEARSR